MKLKELLTPKPATPEVPMEQKIAALKEIIAGATKLREKMAADAARKRAQDAAKLEMPLTLKKINKLLQYLD